MYVAALSASLAILLYCIKRLLNSPLGYFVPDLKLTVNPNKVFVLGFSFVVSFSAALTLFQPTAPTPPFQAMSIAVSLALVGSESKPDPYFLAASRLYSPSTPLANASSES